jgi:hypothetical protein
MRRLGATKESRFDSDVLRPMRPLTGTTAAVDTVVDHRKVDRIPADSMLNAQASGNGGGGYRGGPPGTWFVFWPTCAEAKRAQQRWWWIQAAARQGRFLSRAFHAGALRGLWRWWLAGWTVERRIAWRKL